MKLLFVTKYIDHILYFLLERLAQETELTIICDQRNDWTGELAASGIRLIHLAPLAKFDRTFRSDIETLYAAGQWDIIQSFHGNAQLANLIRWNRRGIPLVAYRARIGHLKFHENPTTFWNARNPRLAAVAAVSSEVKRYLEDFRFLRARNVHVVHHGINRQWVESQCAEPYGLRDQLGIDPEALIVATMAALRPVKRFEFIVHAAEKLQRLPIHFVHLGQPEGWDDKTAHLPKIHFLGHHSRPFAILADADVFAMTSHNEAFGRANLEAMACGKPVIGSNSGGLLDLVEPGVSGELFETTSPDDFVAKLESYYLNRALVLEHGRNALRRVDEHFTTQLMAAGYLQLYRDVLAV